MLEDKLGCLVFLKTMFNFVFMHLRNRFGKWCQNKKGKKTDMSYFTLFSKFKLVETTKITLLFIFFLFVN